MRDIVIEVCTTSVESAIVAQHAGAQRIELCDNLYEGGTTPSFATIELARKHLTIGLNVLIRPRGGDFCYSPLEFEIMKRDIEIAKQLGADGVVLGVLDTKANIDVARCLELIHVARPMSVTFHRAFDMASQPIEAFENLIQLGVERLLTSGLQQTAQAGVSMLARLVALAGNRLVVMAGGGIKLSNANTIVEQSGVKEIHLTASKFVASKMEYRNPHIAMGGLPAIPEFENRVVDEKVIEQLCQMLAD